MEIDLVGELCDSKIVHLGLLQPKEVELLKDILRLDKDFEFDMIMLMNKSS